MPRHDVELNIETTNRTSAAAWKEECTRMSSPTLNNQTASPRRGVGAGASAGTNVAPSLSVETLPFTQFVWGAGVECSFLPHLKVDQFEWTQHDRFWREDLRRAREELGLTHLRYALPWHVLEPQRGKFNWAMADERIEEFGRLGIDLMMDVM